MYEKLFFIPNLKYTTHSNIDDLIKYYKEDGQEFFAKTGEYLSGTPLQGDLDVCSTIIKNTQ